MKRFFIDSFLIILLVMLGSGFIQDEGILIDDKINEFENDIEENIPYENYLPDKEFHVNKATLFAQKSGEAIEGIVSISVELIASIFQAIVD